MLETAGQAGKDDVLVKIIARPHARETWHRSVRGYGTPACEKLLVVGCTFVAMCSVATIYGTSLPAPEAWRPFMRLV